MAHYKGDANEATRAMHISRRREKAKEELEERRRKVEGDIKLSTIDNQFATHTDSVESQLKSTTVGLVTLDQMRQKQEDAVKEREKQLAQKETNRSLEINLEPNLKSTKETSISKSLSFYDDDDEDDGEDDDDAVECDTTRIEKSNEDSSVTTDRRLSPDVNESQDSTSAVRKKRKLDWDKLNIDTSLLPDRDREDEERKLREKLASEWRARQQKLKEEEIEITFSYWDGSGHRRVVRMKKGDSIYQFLQACLEVLRKDFNELRSVSADQLVYVKEDLIIPHHYTFYDFIVTKARGKSGPLFSFDVHEDVRLVADASVEKDESHAGKVLLRRWYERNKHIFPASRWEPYDPTRSYDKYTISDKRSK